MVMGPSGGLLLGDLGADVIKVEPIGGDKTRLLHRLGRRIFRDVQPQQAQHLPRT